MRNTKGPKDGLPNDTTALSVKAGSVHIGHFNARNFDAGTALELLGECAGTYIKGTISDCERHIAADKPVRCGLDILIDAEMDPLTDVRPHKNSSMDIKVRSIRD